MKTLELDNVDNYDLLYEGLVTSSTKGLETRILGKVLTKLEEAGVKKETSALYTLAQDATLQLEDAEYELVKRLINNVEWNGQATKKASVMLEWLDTAR